jgi:hypothetical protein
LELQSDLQAPNFSNQLRVVVLFLIIDFFFNQKDIRYIFAISVLLVINMTANYPSKYQSDGFFFVCFLFFVSEIFYFARAK